MRRGLVLLLALVLVPSCATMTSDRFEEIAVSSSPSGADATLVCARATARGVTPASLRIRRNAGDCDLTIAKDGFATQALHFEQGVNRAYWLNMPLAILAPVGAYAMTGDRSDRSAGVGLLAVAIAAITTDFWTGAVHDHEPHRVDVVLEPARR